MITDLHAVGCYQRCRVVVSNFSEGFLSPSRQTLEQYLKTGHDRSLSRYS